MKHLLSGLIASGLMGVAAFSHGAACPDDTDTATISAAECTITGTASAFTIQFNQGFNDSAVVAPIDGNPGTTVGQQRKRAFIKAAGILADSVKYTVPGDSLVVDARFSALSCSSNAATLGSAGAGTYTGSGSANAKWQQNTYYPIGLWSEVNGTRKTANADIQANFNSDLGDNDCLKDNFWYYGYQSPPGRNIGFVTVLLHEMTHGLGFASLVNATTGSKANNWDDVFSNFLYDADNGAWPDITNNQRANSAISVNKLLWDGNNVNAQAVGKLTEGFQDNNNNNQFDSNDRVQMFAPNPHKQGSSVSHFDTAAFPNELMEPDYTAGQLDLGLALYLLKDIGWQVNTGDSDSNTPPTLNAVNQTTNEDVTKIIDLNDWANDIDNDALSYTVVSCANNITCSISGSQLTLKPADNHFGNTHAITIRVSDGQENVSDSFNLSVTPVNDKPEWDAISKQSVEQSKSITLNLNNYASDIENDSLTYSVANCSEHLVCSVSSNILTLTAKATFEGSVSVTVTANDGNGGSASVTFDVDITNGNTAPIFDVPNQVTKEDTNLVLNLTNFASDAEMDALTFKLVTCGNNIDCTLAGGQLTLKPNENFTGRSTITVSASDAKFTTPDSFELSVSEVNDKPTLKELADVYLKINTQKTINLIATDIDSNTLTYSVTADNSLNTRINGQQLTIAPQKAGSFPVKITVSDGSLQDTQTFNAIVYEEITLSDKNDDNSTPIKNGDVEMIGLDHYPIIVKGGSGQFLFSLSFEGQEADDLLTVNGSTVTLLMPTPNQFSGSQKGAYAGEYVLKVVDKEYNESNSMTFVRPPKISISTAQVLDKQTHHTLMIEGGSVNSSFTLQLSDGRGVTFSDEADESVNLIRTQAANPNSSVSLYNFAQANLSFTNRSQVESATINATSVYTDVESTVSIHPSTWVNVQVVNQNNISIGNAQLGLKENANLTAFKSESIYQANVQGSINILIPLSNLHELDTNNDGVVPYAASISAPDYRSQDIVLTASSEELTVTLLKPEIPVEISGTIRVNRDDIGAEAKQTVNFFDFAPVVVLTLSDGTTQTVIVEIKSATTAVFRHTHDMSDGNLSSISVTQPSVQALSQTLSSSQDDADIELILNASDINELLPAGKSDDALDKTPIPNPADGGSPVGAVEAGSLNRFYWLFMGLLFMQSTRRKRSA